MAYLADMHGQRGHILNLQISHTFYILNKTVDLLYNSTACAF